MYNVHGEGKVFIRGTNYQQLKETQETRKIGTTSKFQHTILHCTVVAQ